MKKLTTNKIEFIVDNFYEKSTIEYKKLEKLKSAEELHFLAQIYNWDYDLNVLRNIIQSHNCDKATALMIFWRACPNDILEFANEEEAGHESESFNLVKEIIEKYTTNQFVKTGIAYDPKEDNHGDVLNIKHEKIDEIFYIGVKGEKFPEYEWGKKENISRTLVSQQEANGFIKIKTNVRSVFIGEHSSTENIENVICLNEHDVEKEIPFPKELWDQKFQYNSSTNSWTACFVLIINSKCEITNIIFTVADNNIILDCGNYLSYLKFKLTEEILNITMAEIVVEVTYSINRFIEKTKEELDIDKMLDEAMNQANRQQN